MLSFTKIITLSAMALGTLTQAVPLLQRSPSSDSPATDLVSRDASTLESVIDGLVVKLTNVLEPVEHVTKVTAGALDLEAIFEDVADIIDDATNAIKALVGKPVEDILKGKDSVELTVSDVLRLVCAVVEVIFKALQTVLNVVDDVTDILTKVVPIVIKAIQCLLQAVIEVTVSVYGNAIVVGIQALVGETLVSSVLAVLRLGAIVIVRL